MGVRRMEAARMWFLVRFNLKNCLKNKKLFAVVLLVCCDSFLGIMNDFMCCLNNNRCWRCHGIVQFRCLKKGMLKSKRDERKGGEVFKPSLKGPSLFYVMLFGICAPTDTSIDHLHSEMRSLSNLQPKKNSTVKFPPENNTLFLVNFETSNSSSWRNSQVSRISGQL